MVSLPDVTLCCIDTRFPELGFDALQRSSQDIEFGEVVFITGNDVEVPANTIPKLRIVRTESISSVEAYSTFMIKELADHISTSHCLIIQWDGFVIHPERWNDGFLNYDYVGAPWQTRDGLVVGNGGFSLRSTKLLKALSSEKIIPHHPEDDCICFTNRRLLENGWGITFAPVEIANRFSFEFTAYDRQFGFHGLSNFPDILDPEELRRFVDRMPETLFVNEYFIVFCKKVCSSGDKALILRLSEKITTYLKVLSHSTHTKKQNDFLVESLINLQLYAHALTILTERKYGAQWKLKYLKTMVRQRFGNH